ncbi:MAG: histidine kinase [Robiginitomaculum sp.]|nr:MAG: histidine kinase [Robiginitomaculum sp.]
MKRRFGVWGERRRGVRRFIFFSTLTRMIFLANLLGLIILIIGALALNQFSRGLIEAKIDSLTSQTRLITNLLGDQATGEEGMAVLDEVAARRIIAGIDLPEKARVRLYDKNGRLVSDSALLDDRVETGTLDPIVDTPQAQPRVKWWVRLQNWTDARVNDFPVYKKHRQRLQRHLERDIKSALRGNVVAAEQYEGDALIVAVALPVKRVREILGVVVFETHDVDTILASQRQGLTPIILLAILASLLSSLALTLFIALPVRKLARATEQVLSSSEKRDTIPDLSARGDEIGDLSLALRVMTAGMYSRVDDIANFAADVAHEIKNPLTSLRSASETLRIAKTKAQRTKMIDIIESDVARMDRLVTDISKASRMDAALAREPSQPLDVEKFLSGMADFYTQTKRETGVDVVFVPSQIVMASVALEGEASGPIIVRALENSFGQVLRNLVDNAITFSPKNETASPKNKTASVRLSVGRGSDDHEGMAIVRVEDDGPGIPADMLETIFDRFYTQRPKGAVFGNHSGLGLAICKQIMVAHKGTIAAANRLDDQGEIKGACFTLHIPLHTPSKLRRAKGKKG